jgi:hypothetical protein
MISMLFIPIETQIICNNVISKIKDLDIEKIPQYTKGQTCHIEKEVLRRI